MLAIDTNIIVRYLLDDDPKQSAKARAILETETVFVATTVLLETEWVLRGAYDLPPDRVVKTLAAFAGLANVTMENPPLVANALRWAEQGLDFADALHLAAAKDCDAFASFDRDFTKFASKIGEVAVRTP